MLVCSINHPILDQLKRIVVVLVAKPKDPSYDSATRRVFEKMTNEGESASFVPKETNHCRGSFPAINVGVSLGPGDNKPRRVSVGKHDEMVQRLLNDGDVQRLASHQDGRWPIHETCQPDADLKATIASFKLWAPKLHQHYREYQGKLRAHIPDLKPNFPRSVFSSMAFNFGPNVETIPHQDILNLPYGWCAIQALGDFDPQAGGHIVLWELKLIIEFPPGSIILIPSATITHSNLPVRAGDQRASITQYTGGSIFRYVDSGFMLDCELKAKSRKLYDQVYAEREGRWMTGLSYLSKYENGKLC